MKYFLLIGLGFYILSCSQSSEFNVKYYGALKNIMKENDLSAHIHLSEFKNENNFYALGAVENLKGEILIIDSKPFYIYRSNDKLGEEEIDVKNTFDIGAAFAVTAQVNNWKEFSIPLSLKSKIDLEAFILEKAKESKIDINQPFPFMVEGLTSSVSWHVIDWPENDDEHTHEKHLKNGYKETSIYEKIKILGFYSDSHQGVFTHHSSNTHMHVINDKGSKGGHVDDLVLGEEMILKLPK